MQLDTTSYRKDRKHPLQHGYGVSRPGGPSRRSLSAIRAILIHTTNNRKGNTHYVPEAAFLRDSVDVSAHYVVSSHDQAVVQILGETEIAWHAGDCADNDYENETSIGIEIAWTINKGPLPQQAIDNVTDLVRAILQRCPQIRKIDMHRAQAIDKNGRLGRKVDPSGWATPDFYQWRDALLAAPTLAVPAPPARKYRIKPAIPGGYVQVRQGRGTGYPEASIAGLSARLRAGEVVEVDDVTRGWAHLASGLGFIEAWALEVAVGASPIALPDDLPIIGSPSVGAARLRRMVDLCASRRPEAERDAITNAISDLATKANISDVCILSQAAKETGNFTSDRYVKSYNFAGLGATNDGAWGSTFDGVYSGLRAMIGHLLNYATTPEAMTQEQRLIASFDPRADALKKAHGFGCAPRWVDLWQKWGVIAPPNVPPPKMSKDAYGMSILIRARSYLEATT